MDISLSSVKQPITAIFNLRLIIVKLKERLFVLNEKRREEQIKNDPFALILRKHSIV